LPIEIVQHQQKEDGIRLAPRRRAQDGEEPTDLLSGIFGWTAYCPKETSLEYHQTIHIWNPTVFLYTLFNPQSINEDCGSICATLCGHQPCRADYRAPDSELCFCETPEEETKCGANSVCIEEDDICECNPGYTGDPLGGCVDQNECILSNPCGSNGECVNLMATILTRTRP